MRLSLKALKHFIVETASGAKLGAVYDIVLESEGQLVFQYLVKPSLLSKKVYLIGRDQILRFTDTKIIVEDALIKEKETSVKEAAPSPEAAV